MTTTKIQPKDEATWALKDPKSLEPAWAPKLVQSTWSKWNPIRFLWAGKRVHVHDQLESQLKEKLEQTVRSTTTDMFRDAPLNPEGKKKVLKAIEAVREKLLVEAFVESKKLADAALPQKKTAKWSSDYLKKTGSKAARLVEYYQLMTELHLQKILKDQVGVISPEFMEHNGRISMMTQAPSYLDVIASGGGAKGPAVVAALEVFEKLELLNDLSHSTAVSVGSIIFYLNACGVSAEDIAKALDDNPPEKFLETQPGFSERYTDVKRIPESKVWKIWAGKFLKKHANAPLHNDGGNIMEILDPVASRSIVKFLKEKFPTDEHFEKPNLKLSQRQIERLKMLRDQNLNDFNVDRRPYLPTFGDLQMLSDLDPGKFKNLTVTASEVQQDRPLKLTQRVLNANTAPNERVLSWVMCSSTLPAVYHEAKVKLMGGDGTFIDGGYFGNLRTDLGQAKGVNDEDTQARRLVLMLDEHDGYRQLHNHKTNRYVPRLEKIQAKVMGLLGRKFSKNLENEDAARAYESGLAVFPINHGTLDVASFGATPLEVLDCKTQAKLSTVKQLKFKGVLDYMTVANYTLVDPSQGSQMTRAQRIAAAGQEAEKFFSQNPALYWAFLVKPDNKLNPVEKELHHYFREKLLAKPEDKMNPVEKEVLQHFRKTDSGPTVPPQAPQSSNRWALPPGVPHTLPK